MLRNIPDRGLKKKNLQGDTSMKPVGTKIVLLPHIHPLLSTTTSNIESVFDLLHHEDS